MVAEFWMLRIYQFIYMLTEVRMVHLPFLVIPILLQM